MSLAEVHPHPSAGERLRREGLHAGVLAGLAFVALAISGMTGCRPGKPSYPEIDRGDVQIELGIAGVVEPTRWNLLRVRVRNRGADFRGMLEVRGVSAGTPDAVRYRKPLEVPGKGAAREVSIPVRPHDWTDYRVTFSAAGWSRTFEDPVPLVEETGPRVLAISKGPVEIGGILTKLLRSTMARLPPGELPAEAIAYDPFQVVVLMGTTLAGAPEAAAALARWVERGGTLVAFQGPDWGSGVPEETLDLLGVRPGAADTTPDALLAARIGEAGPPGFHRDLEPGPSTREVWDGLAFIARRGSGLTICFSFGPGPGGYPLGDDLQWLHAVLDVPLARAFSFGGNPGPVLRRIAEDVPSGLSALAGISVPSRTAVVFGVALYVLLGFAVPAFISNRLRRREWTYLAVIIAAGLATLGIYRYGLLSAREGPEAYEVSVLRVHADGKTAEGATFLGVISPRMQALALEPDRGKPAPEAFFQPILLHEDGRRPAFEPGEVVLEAGPAPGLALAPLTLYPNAMMCLRSEYRVPIDAIVGMEPLDGTSGFKLKLENRTRESFRVFHLKGKCFELESARPSKWTAYGSSEDVRTVHKISPRNRFPFSFGSRDEDEQRIQDSVIASILEDGSGEYIVARSSRPVFPLECRGARRRAITFLVFEVEPGGRSP